MPLYRPLATLTGMRVLVVEDHEELAETVAAGLRREGMAVDLALDGPTALECTEANGYDVVVLDRDLPGVHGDQVCKALARGGSRARVLMLTASGTVADRVAGLGLGADGAGTRSRASSTALRRSRRGSLAGPEGGGFTRVAVRPVAVRTVRRRCRRSPGRQDPRGGA